MTGTWSLLRLALRRDRVVLPLWIAIVTVLCWAQVGALEGVYRTAQDRMAYALTTGSSAAARLFGSIDGPQLGSIAMVEVFVFLSLVIAVLNVMLVVRHTRQNEERGRLELVQSTVVAQHASLAAALLLAGALNAVLAPLMAVALVAGGLPTTGAGMMSFALAGVGVTFAAIAAVIAQIAPSARMANGLGIALLAIAFAVRAAGDVGGVVSADGMHVRIAWPSWLSPLGWGQLAYPFGDQRWWALTPYVVAPVLLAAAAIRLESRRDVGRGMLRERRRRASASRWLAGPLGLAARLNRGSVAAWGTALVITGAFGGAFTGEVESMVRDNEQVRAMFEAAGGTNVLVAAYQGIMQAYIGLFTAAFALQVALRIRSEERGAGESVLATGTSRTRWMASHLLVAAIGSVAILAASGLTMRLFTSNGDGGGGIVAGQLAFAPAVLMYVGVVALGFGVSSRLAALLGWGLFGVSVVVLVGTMFELPELVLGVSPLHHVPIVPVDGVAWTPLLVMGSVGLVTTLAGLAAFRRRDAALGA